MNLQGYKRKEEGEEISTECNMQTTDIKILLKQQAKNLPWINRVTNFAFKMFH